MHYKTIKLDIKIPLNIHNFNFCGELRAQSFILRLAAPKSFGLFKTFAPPPHPKNGSTPLTDRQTYIAEQYRGSVVRLRSSRNLTGKTEASFVCNHASPPVSRKNIDILTDRQPKPTGRHL